VKKIDYGQTERIFAKLRLANRVGRLSSCTYLVSALIAFVALATSYIGAYLEPENSEEKDLLLAGGILVVFLFWFVLPVLVIIASVLAIVRQFWDGQWKLLVLFGSSVVHGLGWIGPVDQVAVITSFGLVTSIFAAWQLSTEGARRYSL